MRREAERRERRARQPNAALRSCHAAEARRATARAAAARARHHTQEQWCGDMRSRGVHVSKACPWSMGSFGWRTSSQIYSC